jgi:addiction module RelB/DinJ family antitoxin
MSNTKMTQLQVRIEERSKRAAQRVLEELGLDLSTAVKILCKQIEHSGTFPLEIRDVNGMRPKQIQELQKARREAQDNKKSFRTGKALLHDALR